MNSAGFDQAALGMVPAHQALRRDRVAVTHVDLRLVVEHQPVLDQCPPQIADERKARVAVVIVLRPVGNERAVRLLRPVHRHVGALQQRVDVGAVVGDQAMPALASSSMLMPSASNGACSATLEPVDGGLASAPERRRVMKSANSSPPRRATRSCSRKQDRSLGPRSRRTRSP